LGKALQAAYCHYFLVNIVHIKGAYLIDCGKNKLYAPKVETHTPLLAYQIPWYQAIFVL